MSTTTGPAVDVELPAPGAWEIDSGHAEVAFVGRHFGLTRIRGRFTAVSGTVTIAEPIEESTVEVDIEMASVHSGDQARDDHLRSSDFFDVENHPTARFVATGLTVDGRRGRLGGELTMVGVTRPVTLDVEYLGQAVDPWDNQRAMFSATSTIDRSDWGLTWNMVLDAGGLLVSKEIRLEIDLELVRQAALAA